jgi:hypothetical protein
VNPEFSTKERESANWCVVARCRTRNTAVEGGGEVHVLLCRMMTLGASSREQQGVSPNRSPHQQHSLSVWLDRIASGRSRTKFDITTSCEHAENRRHGTHQNGLWANLCSPLRSIPLPVHEQLPTDIELDLSQQVSRTQSTIEARKTLASEMSSIVA